MVERYKKTFPRRL